MNSYSKFRLGLIFVGLSMFGGCATHDVSNPNLPDSDEEISWLSGCWTNEDGSSREVWSDSFNGLLFGYSVTAKDGITSFFEDLRIEKKETEYVYVASPMGTGSTEFVLTESNERSALFTNPEHDFPQMLHYQRSGKKMTIEVSTLDRSKGFQLNLHECE